MKNALNGYEKKRELQTQQNEQCHLSERIQDKRRHAEIGNVVLMMRKDQEMR